MATKNQIDSPLSGNTGTGSFVGSASPSITTPTITGSNGFNVATFTDAASTTDYFQLSSSTANNATINLISSNTNASFSILAKGAGGVVIGALGGVTNTPLNLSNGVTSLQMNIGALTSGRIAYFPDLTGTVALSGASQNVTFGIMQCSSIYAPNGTGLINPNGVTNAVNYWTISNNSTGQPVYMASAGSDANIGQYFITKGDAGVVLQTAAVSTPPLSIQSGTSSQHTTNFSFSNTAAARTVTFPDATGTLLMTGQAISTVPSIAFSSTTGVVGTTTNDNAAAGSVGEYISASVSSGSAVSLTTITDKNLTSVSLTAGDWDLYYNACFFPANGTQLTRVYSGLTATSATMPGINDQSNAIQTVAITGDGSNKFYNTTGSLRVSISATTTYYCVVQAQFSVSTCSAFGWVWARRRR